MEEWFEIDYQPKDEALAMVADLRGRGSLCYVASNQEQYRADYLSTRLEIRRRFDGALFSYRVGHRKPSPPFMSALDDYVSRKPHGGFVLVDDNAEVRSRAGERGWQTSATLDPTSFQD
jgi:putative hydrolase of the HAD superfamily